jgi:hypothetical protein
MAANCTARRKPRELTERQRTFARLIHSQIPPHRAWPMAGFSSNRGNCYRALKENERLQAYIAGLERRVVTRRDITIDRILNELEDAFELAEAQHNPSAMIAATMAQAKLCGFVTDRKQIKWADPAGSIDSATTGAANARATTAASSFICAAPSS